MRLVEGDYSAAEEIYARYIEKYPDSPRFEDASYLLAYTRFRMGDLGSALDLASRQLQQAQQDASGNAVGQRQTLAQVVGKPRPVERLT